MYQKRTFHTEWNLCSKWYGCYGISSSTHFSKCIYGRPRKHIGSQITSTFQEIDMLFTWHLCLSIDYVLTTLNSFHPNISFTYEKENNSQLPFLDVY